MSYFGGMDNAGIYICQANPKSIWGWLLIAAGFVLAYFLASWEVRKMHLPKKKSLEALRKTLMQDQDYADLR